MYDDKLCAHTIDLEINAVANCLCAERHAKANMVRCSVLQGLAVGYCIGCSIYQCFSAIYCIGNAVDFGFMRHIATAYS